MGGATVTIEVERLELDLDPALWIFEGAFTDDTVFGGSLDSSDAGFLDFADDEMEDPGPWGDPLSVVTLTLPGTNVYTAIVTNYLSGPDDGDDGLFDYEIRVAPVPEPTTMLLLGAGMIGLAGLGRKKFFRKD